MIPDYPVAVLPPALRDLVDSTNLDPALLAGAGLAAMAIAAAPATMLVEGDPDPVRPILWVPLLGKRSAGKTPARRIAFWKIQEMEREAMDNYKTALRDWEAEGGRKSETDPPSDTTRVVQDITIEMLARMLGQNPYRAQVSDELASIISKLGAYKQNGGGGDRDKWLELWSGETWRYSRVGSGSKPVDEMVPEPVVTVCGTLQDTAERLAMLGEVGTGFRARWLPHLAKKTPGIKGSDRAAKKYNLAIEEAYLDEDRLPWRLREEALLMWQAQAKKWKIQERESTDESDQVLDALSKADTQALRLALVLSEFRGCAPRDVEPETMHAAIAIVNYCVDVWRHLTPSEFLAIRHGDDKIFRAAEAWHDRAVEAGGEVMMNALYRAKVHGVRTLDARDEVVEAYQQHWRVEERKNDRGKKVMWLLAAEVEDDE